MSRQTGGRTMKMRFSPAGLFCTALGVGGLLATSALADVSRPTQLAQNIVIERGPTATVRIVQPEVRIVQPEPQTKVYVSVPGHYEMQKFLVKEGYYKDYRVWVSTRFDPELNSTIYGHYETRRDWVPAKYEYREVWVPAR
jgi:hypothetical protein